MRERMLLVVGTLLLSLLLPAGLFAQDDGPSEELKQLVNEARTAFGEKDFETAIDKLLAAYRIEPNARLLYNTARSYEEIDDCRRALVYYRAFTQHEGAEDNLASKAKEKLSRSDQCEDYSSSLSGRLVVSSLPEGADIVVDGEKMGETPEEVAGLPSGEHTVAVELEGYETAENTLELEAAQDRKISVKLVEAKPEETDSSDLIGASDTGGGSDVAVNKKADEEGASGSAVSIPAVSLAGVGIIGLGIGGYIDLVAIPDTDEERSQYASDTQEYRDLTDKRQGQVTTALVGYIGGSALLAAGATWLILDLTGILSNSSESARVQPLTAPRRGGFVGGIQLNF
ncbi:MAG: PEGA domain-containing protein [Myxococcota bacterium]